MFNWFKKEQPESGTVLPTTEIELEKPATVFYRIGATDQNRVSFQMGYTEITMDKDGVNNLIRQLAVFRDQLTDEDSEESDAEGS